MISYHIISSIMAFPPSHSFMFHHHEDLLQLRSASPPSLNNNNAFPSPSLPLPLPLPLPPQHYFQGSGGGASLMMKRSMSFSGVETNNKCDEEELSDEGSQIGELKKKRLNLEQVKALEKSFEVGNKLEPERKMQLAKALGLQPRQIAIWFQNRRARWKTKQLEKEYDLLKKQLQALQADNDTLKTQNHKLHAELQALKNRECSETGTIISLKKEREGCWSNNGSDNSSDMNLDLSRTPVMNSPVSCSHSHQNNNDGKNLLPNSLKPNSIAQLLQCSSSRSDLQDETLCNMFHNIDDHHNFWPWPAAEHHHFH